MKIQFDPNQAFQIEAVNAIGDLFDGQPQREPAFSVIKLAPGDDLFEGHERSELGVGNTLFTQYGYTARQFARGSTSQQDRRS